MGRRCLLIPFRLPAIWGCPEPNCARSTPPRPIAHSRTQLHGDASPIEEPGTNRIAICRLRACCAAVAVLTCLVLPGTARSQAPEPSQAKLLDRAIQREVRKLIGIDELAPGANKVHGAFQLQARDGRP
jgi:hypothetical protein